MPLYFMETNDGDDRCMDEVGIEMRDDKAARKAAIMALPDMARDVLPNGDHRTMSVVVWNEDGRRVYMASMTLTGGWCHDP